MQEFIYYQIYESLSLANAVFESEIIFFFEYVFFILIFTIYLV